VLARPPGFRPSPPRCRRMPCRSWAGRCVRSYRRRTRDRVPGRRRRTLRTDRCCSWPLLALWPPTWWPSPDRRRSLPGAGAVKGLVPKGLPTRCFGRAEARSTRGCIPAGGKRPKDLGTLDGSRGGLILPRRAKVTHTTSPSLPRAAGLPACPQVSRCTGLSVSDRDFARLTGRSDTQRARGGHDHGRI
jgi:hypothetical protein